MGEESGEELYLAWIHGPVHSCCHCQQGKSNDILANHSSSSAVMMSQFIIVIGLIQSFAGCLSCDYVQ